jgi:gliding motility-associated-like protein
MIKWYSYIFPAFLCIYSYNGYSQKNCTTPASPILTSVSVQPETGKTDFTWALSSSAGVAAYIIYSYKEPDGLPIDTIWNPVATSFTITSTATKYFSVSYVMTAYVPILSAVPDSGCVSPLSNVISSIFCTSQLDTCSKKISVTWNRYADYPKHVTEYKILVSKNGGPMSETYTVSNSADNFLISDFETDSQYCFVVSAVLNDGTVSNSNKSCLVSRMQRPPGWINADYATINTDNKVSLSFSIDPLSEIFRFSLERKSGPNGTYREIAQPLSNNGIIQYIDNKADIDTVNYYRLSAVNSCHNRVTVSNPASNMVLSLENKGSDLILSWNSYRKWLGTVSSYTILVNTGKGFVEKATVTGADTVFKFGYKEIMYEVSGGEVCFYINASETLNPYGIAGHSSSARLCTEATEIITVPNVFTPDNDLVNDLFRPVLSFAPVDYHLIIRNRRGQVLFETRDFKQEWDGTYNGNLQPQDVYLWFLRLTTPSGKSISKSGTVTIYRSR